MDKRKRRLLCMLEGSGRKSRWISGVLPLSFKAFAAGTLENYRIYGNTVGGESVGDLEESGEHAGEYKVPVTISNGTDTLTTPIYLPEQIKKVGDEAEYIDYGEQKQHRVRKNLLQNTATSQTVNQVDVTINQDKSIKLSFDSVTYARFVTINSDINLIEGDILTGCPNIGVSGLALRAANNSNTNNASDTGSGLVIPATVAGNVTIAIRVPANYANSNLTFYPMIRKADIEDDTYEPYIENVDLDVTLPALPTLPGTNVLSVGTAVQPSRVEVKGKIKAL